VTRPLGGRALLAVGRSVQPEKAWRPAPQADLAAPTSNVAARADARVPFRPRI
jgi:hypothetical protein